MFDKFRIIELLRIKLFDSQAANKHEPVNTISLLFVGGIYHQIDRDRQSLKLIVNEDFFKVFSRIFNEKYITLKATTDNGISSDDVIGLIKASLAVTIHDNATYLDCKIHYLPQDEDKFFEDNNYFSQENLFITYVNPEINVIFNAKYSDIITESTIFNEYIDKRNFGNFAIIKMYENYTVCNANLPWKSLY